MLHQEVKQLELFGGKMFDTAQPLHPAFQSVKHDIASPRKAVVLVSNGFADALCKLARAIRDGKIYVTRSVIMPLVVRDDEAGKVKPGLVQRPAYLVNVQKTGTSIHNDQIRPTGHSHGWGIAGTVGYNDLIASLQQVRFHRTGFFCYTFDKQHL
jgi:hypothetical protein